MSYHDIFDSIEYKLWKSLASPISDCIARDNRVKGSITEVEMMSFSDNKTSTVTTNSNGLVVSSNLTANNVTLNQIHSTTNNISFNNCLLTDTQFPDPTSSGCPVNKGFFDTEIGDLQAQLDKINNYLLILSKTYIIKDQTGTVITF